ncbi:MAG: hypothetical protein K5874_03430 [Bacteroidaceae bacterium]|nr:hypothetical protein [Bacteroidaceae bacterium]
MHGRLHCNHLKHDIDQFVKNVTSELVDKHDYEKELVDKWSIKPNLADKLSDILLFMVDKEENIKLLGGSCIISTSA